MFSYKANAICMAGMAMSAGAGVATLHNWRLMIFCETKRNETKQIFKGLFIEKKNLFFLA